MLTKKITYICCTQSIYKCAKRHWNRWRLYTSGTQLCIRGCDHMSVMARSAVEASQRSKRLVGPCTTDGTIHALRHFRDLPWAKSCCSHLHSLAHIRWYWLHVLPLTHAHRSGLRHSDVKDKLCGLEKSWLMIYQVGACATYIHQWVANVALPIFNKWFR